MTRVLIVGSGPAAAGVALALADRDDVSITVLDLGLDLEAHAREAVRDLAAVGAEHWSTDALTTITRQPEPSRVRGLPEKRAYGSDYPFRDAGQLADVDSNGSVHRALVTAAYGGFSSVWGAQVTPFPEAAFRDWPARGRPTHDDYRAVLSHIPFAGERDDLEHTFPLLVEPAPLPHRSPRTERVLAAYKRHRRALNRLGVRVGYARLAFDATRCVCCGLCMTGCPYSLVYSAAQTFDTLRRSGRVRYHDGLLAVRVGEDGDTPFVDARDVRSGTFGIVKRFEADRVFVACGGVGTTRLVATSLAIFDAPISLAEPAQFVLPFLSVHGTTDPRRDDTFTLNQFNMLVALDADDRDLSQVHFYTYNPAFLDAVPRVLRDRAMSPVLTQLLRRLCVGVGYLPSWRSPRIELTARAPTSADTLAPVVLTRDDPRWPSNVTLRRVLWRVVRSARRLDLWPLLPMMTLSGGGKSYHWGGSFPHRDSPSDVRASDVLGRVQPWRRVHLVDGSVFPDIAATTFTLTVMANAHRIASQALSSEP